MMKHRQRLISSYENIFSQAAVLVYFDANNWRRVCISLAVAGYFHQCHWFRKWFFLVSKLTLKFLGLDYYESEEHQLAFCSNRNNFNHIRPRNLVLTVKISQFCYFLAFLLPLLPTKSASVSSPNTAKFFDVYIYNCARIQIHR